MASASEAIPIVTIFRPFRKTYSKPPSSIGLGVLVGFLLLTVLGWIPIIGALISGLVAGAIARGAKRGLAAGFIAGIIGAIILAVLLSALAVTLEIIGAATLGGMIGAGIDGAIVLLSLSGAIICAIGGLVGGTLRGRE